MSTRASILIKDSNGDSLWFYRHSDGYSEGAMPTLTKFMQAVKDGIVRDNVGQASGWLVLLGSEEYSTQPDFTEPDFQDNPPGVPLQVSDAETMLAYLKSE